MTEEEQVLLLIKGAMSDLPEESKAVIVEKIKKIKEIASDELGMFALAYCGAELTSKK